VSAHEAGHIVGDDAAETPVDQGVTAVQARPLDAPIDRDRDVREFAQLTLKKRELEGSVKQDDPRRKQLEQRILDDLAERGLKGVDLAGIGKVSIKKQLWAKVKRDGDTPTEAEKEAAAQALKDAGLDDYVNETFNLQTVSSLYREWKQQGVEPPAQLEDYWEVEPKYSLGVYIAK
jgi:hypothetical protein